ncbi:MAG: hypothetical protein U9N49_08830 [Campylobacterota bacterium]|nr:hypothetical protein [Campylobacterota bacterium]
MSKITKPHLISQILHIGLTTYYKYVKNNYPIIIFLQQFSLPELQELLNTNNISKIDSSLYIKSELFDQNKHMYLSSFRDSLQNKNEYFILFYFSFLRELHFAAKNKSKVDTLLFSSSFHIASSKQLVNTYLSYFNLMQNDVSVNVLMSKTYILYNNFEIFDNWDFYMLLFLKESMGNNLKNLYNKNESKNNKNEAIYHIIGFIVFTNSKYINSSDVDKLNIINVFYNKFLKITSKSNSVDVILQIIFDS